jgi:hypothetical protein
MGSHVLTSVVILSTGPDSGAQKHPLRTAFRTTARPKSSDSNRREQETKTTVFSNCTAHSSRTSRQHRTFSLRLGDYRAKKLLQGADDLSPAQVTARMWFLDQGHSSCHFNQLVGVTPKRFR